MSAKKYECTICNVVTTSESSYNDHLLGTKHKNILHHQMLINKEKCSVYITNLPTHTSEQQFKQFFRNYGPISSYHQDPRHHYLIIQFETETAAQQLLNKNVSFQGHTLIIRPRNKNSETANELHSNSNKLSIIDIRQKINNFATFEDQLDTLLTELKPTSCEKRNQYKMRTDLQSVLSTQFPNCKLWPFGSTVNDLNFRFSDVDIFVEVSSEPPWMIEASVAATYIKKAKKALCKSRLFIRNISIPNARTPIIKCVHSRTGIECDFNFTNQYAIYNSYLIHYLLSTETLIKKFMLILKFWAKVHNICGVGRMSNYALNLLVIFHLQKQNVLPAVAELQTGDNENMQHEWNCGFNKNLVFDMKTFGLQKGLFDFFQFYGNFNFAFEVVTPLSGKEYPKTDFLTRVKLPDVFHRYATSNKAVLNVNTAMCIQDPFELNHNVTANLSAKNVDDFQKLCKLSATICSSKNPRILEKLFEEQVLPVTLQISNSTCNFRILVGSALTSMGIESETICREKWYKKVQEFTTTTMKSVMLIEMNAVTIVSVGKKSKVETPVEILDSLKWHCVGRKNVWEARKNVAKMLKDLPVSDKEIIERETAITDHISNVVLRGVLFTESMIDFDLTLKFQINPVEVTFFVENKNSKNNTFGQFAQFVSSKLPIWFDKFMKNDTSNA